MANQTLPGPQIVLDADGLPVPGAQAFYYQSGTLTLISVYSDQAGTIPTTNPVIADGNGALAQSYVTVTAKVIVKDSLGATLYTLDPVPVIQSVGSGASQISFNPTVLIPSTDVQAAVALVDTNWRAGVVAAQAASQPVDLDLTAVAGLSGAGIAVRTAANTWAQRTITSTDGSVVVTNPGGVAGDINMAVRGFECRAWVNFNGSGVVAIRASGNVSSITDNGVGDYTVNFTTALADVNFAISLTGRAVAFAAGAAGSLFGEHSATARTTSAVTVVRQRADTAAAVDTDLMQVAVFR